MGSRRVMVLASHAPSLLNFRGDLLRELLSRGDEVVACAPDGDGDLERGLADLGVRLVRVPLDRSGLNPVRDLGTLWRLVRLLRKEKPHLLFSYTVKPVLYGSLAARLTGVSAISLITGLGSLFVTRTTVARLARPLVHGLYRLALAGNRAVVFQNPDDRALFVHSGLVDERRCHQVAGSGVNLTVFAPSPVPPGSVRFLLIARLLVDKGIREFAEALAILRERGHAVQADLVGPLEEHPRAITREELDRWCADGLLTWHGPADDVRPYLAACSVYVLPSYREGTPRSVLEAMATGRAVVTTDAPGCRETVTPDHNGVLVPVRDAGALADALERFLERPDLVATMGACSLELVRQRFDVRRVNAALMTIFDGPG